MSTFPSPKRSLIPPVWLPSHEAIGWGEMGKRRKGEVEPGKCSVDSGGGRDRRGKRGRSLLKEVFEEKPVGGPDLPRIP